MTMLRGAMKLGSRTPIRQVEDHFPSSSEFDALGMRFGTGASVYSTKDGGLAMSNPLPSVNPFVYAITDNGTVLWGEYPWDLRATMAKGGMRGTLRRVPIGARITITPDGKDHIEDLEDYRRQPANKLGLDASVTPLMDQLVATTAEAYGSIKADKPVLAFSSAGTDSTLACWALKEAGIPFKAVCVGRTPEDDDPYYAELYAKDIGFDYEFVGLPDKDDEEAWQNLTVRAIDAIQMVDMSNVMMGICEQLGIDRYPDHHTWYGYYADIAVGAKTNCIYSYRKVYPQTRKTWLDHVYQTEMYTDYPNTHHIARVAKQRSGKIEWRTPFMDHRLLQFISGCSRDCFSGTDSVTKPLLRAATGRLVERRSWDEKKKIGFYSGAGISKLRNAKFPYLQDRWFQEVGRRVRETRNQPRS